MTGRKQEINFFDGEIFFGSFLDRSTSSSCHFSIAGVSHETRRKYTVVDIAAAAVKE